MYQDCWDILKQDLLDVFEDFYNYGVVNSVTNSTYVCLIPEKDEHMRLSEFRPISLETSLYKIIAKVFSLRLRGCKGRLFLLLRVLLKEIDIFWMLSSLPKKLKRNIEILENMVLFLKLILRKLMTM